jgi:tRNA(Ile)-lysidine synthase
MTDLKSRAHNTLLEKLVREAREHGTEALLMQGNLVVGVSGGADSLALLHALCTLRGDNARATLHVAHLEHGVRGSESSADADFVAGIAQSWGLNHTVKHADVPALAKKYRLSTEDAARRVRYTFLASLAEELNATVTVAHTADDQAETVLMSILRGSGLAGLAGMQPLSNVPLSTPGDTQGDGVTPTPLSVRVFRPMLSIWREEVIEYCTEHGLRARMDATNLELTYMRNRVRLDLLPLMQARYNPAIKQHLYNLAEIVSADESLLESLIGEAWESVASYDPNFETVRVHMARFAGLHLAMQRRIARRAIEMAAGTLEGITFQHVTATVATLSGSATSAPRLHLPHNLTVERVDRQQALIGKRSSGLSTMDRPENQRWPWPVMQSNAEVPIFGHNNISLDNGWQLMSHTLPAGEVVLNPGELIANFDLDMLEALGKVSLRTRRPGDSIRPLGMAGRKSLQDLFVDAKIPRSLRDAVSVLALAESNDVLWVPGPGGRRSSHATIEPGTRRILQLSFEWHPES